MSRMSIFHMTSNTSVSMTITLLLVCIQVLACRAVDVLTSKPYTNTHLSNIGINVTAVGHVVMRLTTCGDIAFALKTTTGVEYRMEIYQGGAVHICEPRCTKRSLNIDLCPDLVVLRISWDAKYFSIGVGCNSVTALASSNDPLPSSPQSALVISFSQRDVQWEFGDDICHSPTTTTTTPTTTGKTTITATASINSTNDKSTSTPATPHPRGSSIAATPHPRGCGNRALPVLSTICMFVVVSQIQ